MFTSKNVFTVLRLIHASRVLLGLTLLVVVSALSFNTSGLAQTVLKPPSVAGKVLVDTSILVSVSGDGFTPGGQVQVVVVDLWGNALHEPVWTMAAPWAPFGADSIYREVIGYGDPGSISLLIDLDATALYGPNGSQDPAHGYHAGVDVGNLTDIGSINLRAFDEHTGVWSDFAVVDTDSSLARIHDPQIRYVVPQTCISARFCQSPY